MTTNKTKKLFPILTMLLLALCLSAFVFCISPTTVHAAETHTHNETEFEPWTATDRLPTSGNYYLTEDVVLEGHSIPETVNLCLNGYDVSIGSALYIENDITLNFYDCQNSGALSLSTEVVGSTVIKLKERSVLNIYGGIIDGLGSNSCIDVPVNGKLNMYGGIIRNGAAYSGGGVFCRGAFTMYGGEIKNNHAKADEQYNVASGGGVFLGVYGNLTMYGGFITNNTAVNNEGYDSLGGGICVEGYTGYNYSEIHLYGGEISGNSADVGGGVYLDRGILYMGEATEVNVTQSPLIKNNTASKNGGGIAGLEGSVYINNALIEGNIATTGRGGGVYVLSKLELTDSTVRNNKSGSGVFSGGISGTTALGGLVTIEGNTTADGENANFPCGSITLLDEGLNTDSRIGINNASLKSVVIEEITLLDADASAYKDVFFSDDELCFVYLAEDNSLRFGYIHRDHVWADTYSRNENEHWYECLCEYEDCQMLTRVSGNQYKKGYGTHDLASCMFCDPNLHYHSVCAEEICTHGGAAHDSSVRYIAITMENYDEILELTTNVFDDKIYTFPSGNYYLAEDITIPVGYYLNTTTGGTVNLCLAGYSLSVNSNSTYTPYAIVVSQSATFTICDCGAERTGKIVSSSMGEIIQVEEQGVLNVYGGTLQLLSSSTTNAYGIYGSVYDAYLNFYRGKISVSSAGHIVAVSFKGGVVAYDIITELASTSSTANVADFNVWAKATNGFTLISDEDYSFNVLELSDTLYTTINLSAHTGTATFNTNPAHGAYICAGKASNVIIANEGWGAAVKTINAKQYVTIVHIAHSGGTATCTEKAICSTCETVYGEFEHTGTKLVNNQNGTHDLVYTCCNAVVTDNITCVATLVDNDCSTAEVCVCGYVIKSAASHDFSGAYLKDENGHWHKCENCAVTDTKENHTPNISSATEQQAKVCTECDYEIEAQLVHSHSYTLEIVDEQYKVSDATCTAIAVYYKSCSCGLAGEQTFENGELADHTGGTANCTDKAVCTVCNQPYGDMLGHDFETGDVYSKDNEVHAKKCNRCNAYDTTEAHEYGNDEICDVCGYDKTVPHSHSYMEEIATEEFKATAATCTSSATYYKSCVCGAHGTETFASGDVNMTSHTGTATEIVSNNNGTHDIKYTCCQSVANDNVDCSGGTATCTNNAVCSVCNTEYGDKNANKHTKDTFVYVNNENGTHTKKNECCGTIVKADETHTYDANDECICGKEKPIESPATYTITVENGTADNGNTSVVVNENGSVTVTANVAPEGKKFKGWSINGTVVSTEQSYTFNATADTTITAVYEDIGNGTDIVFDPVEPDGLSAGAVVAIVLASVVALAGGGFAIYWFIFRKRR